MVYLGIWWNGCRKMDYQMKFKDDVSIRGLRDEMYFAMQQIEIAAEVVGNGYEPTITSAVDGKHSVNSLHYDGAALDIRIKDISTDIAVQLFVEAIKEHLTSDYDVVLEGNHIHVEWQPKYQA